VSSEATGNRTLNAILQTYGAADASSNGHAIDYRSDDAVFDRARKYVEKMPAAVSGENGHGRTYHVACVLIKGFELPTSQAMEILKEYNATCDPPWTDHELQHKIDSAAKAGGSSGYLRNAKQERWDKITVPSYQQPAESPAKRRTNGKTQRSRPTRKPLREAVYESMEHSATGKKNLISLGIPDLDRAIGGGVEFGEMIMIAARPSHGKSAIALQIVSQLTLDGIECAFVSEEMSTLSLGKRTIQFVSPVPEQRWAADRPTIEGQIETYFSRRAECHIIKDCGTVERVCEEVEQLAAVGVRAVVVDYVQLLSSSGSRYETVTANSVALRRVCSETGVLMIVLAQMSRAIEGRESLVPKTSDLRESGQLEQDADVLLFLVWPWKMDQAKEKSEYLIYVMKNRNREIVLPLVRSVFDASRQKISGLSTQAEQYDWTDQIR